MICVCLQLPSVTLRYDDVFFAVESQPPDANSDLSRAKSN